VLAMGEVQFVVTIPAGFARELVRGERPAVLVDADATDPMATAMPSRAVRGGPHGARTRVVGPLAPLAVKPGAFEFVVHPRYNPEAISQYNVVPGLIGVILTLTMVLITGLAITRERERGRWRTCCPRRRPRSR